MGLSRKQKNREGQGWQYEVAICKLLPSCLILEEQVQPYLKVQDRQQGPTTGTDTWNLITVPEGGTRVSSPYLFHIPVLAQGCNSAERAVSSLITV
jgi:hypothetical protein